MDISTLNQLASRWQKNRQVIEFEVSVNDDKQRGLVVELNGAPNKFKKALETLTSELMQEGLSYIRNAYQEAIQRKDMAADMEDIRKDLSYRMSAFFKTLFDKDIHDFYKIVNDSANIYADRYMLEHLVFTEDGWKLRDENDTKISRIA